MFPNVIQSQLLTRLTNIIQNQISAHLSTSPSPTKATRPPGIHNFSSLRSSPAPSNMSSLSLPEANSQYLRATFRCLSQPPQSRLSDAPLMCAFQDAICVLLWHLPHVTKAHLLFYICHQTDGSLRPSALSILLRFCSIFLLNKWKQKICPAYT